MSEHKGYRNAKQFRQIMEEALKEEKGFQKAKEVAEKSPDDPKANVEVALAYVKWGLLEKGQPFVDRALKLDPDNATGLLPELHLNLGLHYGQNATGENTDAYFQKAESYFQEIIKRYPDSKSYEPAQYYLGATYMLQEKYEPAIATLEKVKDAKDPGVKATALHMLERIKTLISKGN